MLNAKKKQKTPLFIQYTLFFCIMIGLLMIFFGASHSLAFAHTMSKVGSLDWPTYLHDDGRSSFNRNETDINTGTATRLKRSWTFHAKGAISVQPVRANNLIYWGSWDGVEHATDGKGHEIWKTFIGKTHTCSATIGVASTATVASVPIRGKITSVVFVGGGDAHFYALNAFTGSIIWKTALGSSPSHFLWSSPVLYKMHVYIGVASFGDCPAIQGQLVQLNTTDGVIEHRFNVVPNGCIGGGVWSSPTVDTKRDVLYITTGSPDTCRKTENFVSAVIELQSWDLKLIGFWQVPRSQWVIDSDFGATPTLFTARIGGSLHLLIGVAHKNGIYYAFLRGALSKGPIWNVHIAIGGSAPDQGDGSISPSGWDGSKLYVAGGNTHIRGQSCKGSVRALNPATGAPLWEACFHDGPVLAPVTVVPGIVIVEDGPVITLINTNTSKTLFVYRALNDRSTFYGGSLISEGVLYVGNFNGDLYTFRL